MIDIDVLRSLNRLPDTSFEAGVQFSEIIAVSDRVENNEYVTERVLKSNIDDKYYYTKMIGGAFEVALEITPESISDNVYRFLYLDDTIHVNRITIDTKRKTFRVDFAYSVGIDYGYSVIFEDNLITLIDAEHITINGKTIPVIDDRKVIFKLLKTRIRAYDGAKGLMTYIDNNVRDNFCECYIRQIINQYA